MNSSEKIQIVAASDNHYAILLAALVKSIEVNHKGPEEIDFHIIDDGISAQNKKNIISSINAEVFTFFWHKTTDVVPPNVKIPADKTAFPITTYLRLFAPYIVSKTATRLIYFDVDMIVEADVSALWNSDIGDSVIGAVQDLCETVGSDWGGIPNYKELGFDGSVKYFNAGLMVIDPVKWREGDFSNRVIKDINDNIEHLNFADQYGLNITFYNQWFELDKRWNCFAVVNMADPFVIHYLDIKPIFKSCNSAEKYKSAFFKYLNLTPWKGFKPIPDYQRVLRKGIRKIKKLIVSYLRNR